MSEQQSFFMSPYEEWTKDESQKESRRKSSGGRKSSSKVYDCSTCKLRDKCRSPEIKRYGKGKKKILIVGQCPGFEEDKAGIPFVGRSGAMAKRYFSYAGIDMDEDCWRTNIVQCYPGKDKKGRDKDPTKDQIKCCSARLEKDIEETKPDLIICLGAPAINAVLKLQHLKAFSAGQTHGKVFPCHSCGCWVGCSYHPSFFLHRKGKPDRYPDDEVIFGLDLVDILSYLGEPLPQPLTVEGNKTITDPSEAVDLLERFSNSEKGVSYDYEATTILPWVEEAELLSVSLTNDIDSAIFIPLGLNYDNGEKIFNVEEREIIVMALRKFLSSDAPKVVQNVNMEEIWNRMFLFQPMKNYVHDTMIAAHIINNRSGTTGLGFQAYEMTGHEYKQIVNIKDLLSEPLENVCNRNCWDARYTLMSYYRQKRILKEKGRLNEFYEFFHRGSKALVSLRENGTKIDVSYMNEFEKDYQEERDLRVLEMRSLPGVIEYENESGHTFNPESATRQLQRILYGIYGEKVHKETPTRLGSTDEETLSIILEKTENEEVKKLIDSLFRFRKCCSLIERVANYRKVMDSNHYVHPSFNLNIAETYRSSADSPSIQNVYKRDKELIVFRKCIIPSLERKEPVVPIFEVHDSIDFDTHISKIRETIDVVTNIMCSKRFEWQGEVPLEVEWEIGWNWYQMYPLRVSNSGVYIKIKKDEEITLDDFITRGNGKTRVILEVDYSGMETRLIAISSGDPELTRQIIEGLKWNVSHPEGGVNPYDLHRRWGGKVLRKLIDEVTKDDRYRGKNGFIFPSFYGSTDKNVARSFPEIPVEHVVSVQREFWEEYHYVKEWQNKVIHDYLKDGFVEGLTGWRRQGPLSINQLYNNLIQGDAFHVLLHSLCEIGDRFCMKKVE